MKTSYRFPWGHYCAFVFGICLFDVSAKSLSPLNEMTLYDFNIIRNAKTGNSLDKSIKEVASFRVDSATRLKLFANYKRLEKEPPWKGSFLGVFDGSAPLRKRSVVFSYYGHFFKDLSDGAVYEFTGPSAEEFRKLRAKCLNENFIPARRARNKSKQTP